MEGEVREGEVIERGRERGRSEGRGEREVQETEGEGES